jgi:hypothetical protein
MATPIQFKDLGKFWLAEFPEFVPTEQSLGDWDFTELVNQQVLILSFFGSFFTEKLILDPNAPFINRVFSIINEQFELPNADDDTLLILREEILGRLAETDEEYFNKDKITSSKARIALEYERGLNKRSHFG